MKHVLTILLSIFSLSVSAQIYQNRPEYGWNFNRIKISSTLTLPQDTLLRSNNSDAGAIVYNISDSALYVWNGSWWTKQGRAGSSIQALDSLRYDPATGTFYGRYTTGGELAIQTGLVDSLALRPYSIINNYTYAGWDLSYGKDTAHAGEGTVMNLGGDTLLNIFRISLYSGHVSDSGKVVKRYSYDGGTTWSTTSDVYNSQYDDRNISGGLVNNRVVIFFRRYNTPGASTVDIGYIYSDDRGVTWSAYSPVTLIQQDGATGPFGDIVKANGRWLKPVSSDYTTELFSSTDGATWTSLGLMWDYRVSHTYRTNETALVYFGTDSLIALARDNSSPQYAPFQFKSTDNGTTWSYVGHFTYPIFLPAPYMVFDSAHNKILYPAGERTDPTQRNRLLLFTANPQEVFNDVSKWVLTSVMQRPRPNNTSLYGYPVMTKLSNGDYYTSFSDRRQRYSDTTNNQLAEVGELFSTKVSWLANTDKPSIPYGENALVTNIQGNYFTAEKKNYAFTYDSIANIITPRYGGPMVLYGTISRDSLPVLEVRTHFNTPRIWLYGGRKYDGRVADFAGYITSYTAPNTDSSFKNATTEFVKKSLLSSTQLDLQRVTNNGTSTTNNITIGSSQANPTIRLGANMAQLTGSTSGDTYFDFQTGGNFNIRNGLAGSTLFQVFPTLSRNLQRMIIGAATADSGSLHALQVYGNGWIRDSMRVGAMASGSSARLIVGGNIAFTIGSDVANDMYRRAGNGAMARIAPGTNGQFLRSVVGVPTFSDFVAADVPNLFVIQRAQIDTVVAKQVFTNSSSGTLTMVAGATNPGGQIDLAGGVAATNPGTITFRSGTGAGTQTIRGALLANGSWGFGATTATSTIQVTGSFALSDTATAGSITLGANTIIRVTNSAHVITLPTASTCRGRIYDVLNETAGSVTITSVIDFATGAGNTTIPTKTSWRLYSDGTNWRLLSRSN